ncbi:hypothetical protein SADFL11_00010170 [Roseibium alexandrii DFL-11]|uniref:Uncharacterized protein n=1 Tax=Roseibium alexandrii (strain DSM 17067 / NCIMB 14079 / DFL-11) TaxID=244592 RepID=A0A5E8UXD2_ROSAD|nr:hypothetical protein SADFL11_00010170 [Roseibium alexandrii DFL-11]
MKVRRGDPPHIFHFVRIGRHDELTAIHMRTKERDAFVLFQALADAGFIFNGLMPRQRQRETELIHQPALCAGFNALIPMGMTAARVRPLTATMILTGSPFLNEQMIAVEYKDRHGQMQHAIYMGLQFLDRIKRSIRCDSRNYQGLVHWCTGSLPLLCFKQCLFAVALIRPPLLPKHIVTIGSTTPLTDAGYRLRYEVVSV